MCLFVGMVRPGGLAGYFLPGRLRVILGSSFVDIFDRWPEHIRKDLSRLAPTVGAWLEE
jgi:hypothetical protein